MCQPIGIILQFSDWNGDVNRTQGFNNLSEEDDEENYYTTPVNGQQENTVSHL